MTKKELTLKEIHLDSLKSLSAQAHTETIIYRVYQVVSFFCCYVSARTMFSRYLWIKYQGCMAAFTFSNVCAIAIACLLVMPPVIFNFVIAMGMPPHFDPGNQRVMKQILEKYPLGGVEIAIEGEVNSEDDLPSSKLRQEYYQRNPWTKCELNLFAENHKHVGDLAEPLNP